MLAPANLKIDGKAQEWGNQFQAFNKAAQIFYTLANDDNYLYLIVQTSDANIIEKIIRGGVSLTVNVSAKKKGKNTVAVTFPFYERNGPGFDLALGARQSQLTDSAKNKVLTDSFVRAKNRKLTENLKWIGLRGIKAIADTIISIYNDNNIKVSFSLNDKLNYTCELAVPLSYLGINKAEKFFYNIQLNGAVFYAVKLSEVRPGIYAYTTADGKSHFLGMGPDGLVMTFASDFWGEYMLVKKITR